VAMNTSKQVTKYIISGGGASLVDLMMLYALTELLGIWYVASATIAFVLAFFTSFLLQKLWTFGSKDFTYIFRQLIDTLGVTLISVAVNVLGVYLLTEKLGMWYILAQVILLTFLALCNFFVYKHLIFKEHSSDHFLPTAKTETPKGKLTYGRNSDSR